MTPIEKVALAIKAEIGRQFNATPMPHSSRADDWTAIGGTIDLEEVAGAAIDALADAVSDEMVTAAGDVDRCGYSAPSPLNYKSMISAAIRSAKGE